MASSPLSSAEAGPISSRPVSAQADRAFCRAMLPLVSRTFALCIRFLPEPLETSVEIAYLLCRVADTIEDAPRLSPPEKRALLIRFRDALSEDAPDLAPLARAFEGSDLPDEQLATRADAVLREFHRLPSSDQQSILPWVREMCDGMADFADVAGAEGPEGLRSLPDEAALDRYCYYVAGTVGHLLTGLFQLRFSAEDGARAVALDQLATSFGLGLQLTNIVKDVADDRQRGWSFVPRDLCELMGISPDQLGDPDRRQEARRVIDALIAKAQRHLDDAVRYCTLLPHRAYGIRVFCLVSVYLAARTLALASRDDRMLQRGHKVKITRSEVYRTVLATHLAAPSNHLIRAYYRRLSPRPTRAE